MIYSTCTVKIVRNCLVCYSEVCNLPLEKENERLLSKDIHIIFILRKLLEIPQERLVDYLSNAGADSPSGWGVRLCSRCKLVVENARGIYEEMLRTTQVFKTAREEIVEILRGSECINRRGLGIEDIQQGFGDSSDISQRIVEETRNFVCEHNYGYVGDNPFKHGDLLAENVWTENLLAAQRLREAISRKSKRNMSVNNTGFGFCMLHLCKDATGERFQCPLCSQVFSHLSKMKFHTIRVHLEHLLESARLPETSEHAFQACCKTLLVSLTPESVTSTMESTKINSCSHCGKGFTDKRYLHCHWVQHHNDVLVDRLKNLQKSSLPAIASSSQFIPKGIAKRGNKNKSIITCSQCRKSFADVESLKVHIVVSHTEQYFPSAQFNVGNIVTTEEFRVCCQNLFRNEKYKVVGNESFKCPIPMCDKTYISKRNVYVHMLDSHYEIMAAKLMELLKLPSSKLPGWSKNSKKKEAKAQNLPSTSITSPMENCLVTMETTESPPVFTSPIGSTPRAKRKDNMRIPTFICIDCGTRFGHSSVLNRHRKLSCPVLRSLGLITDESKQREIQPSSSRSLQQVSSEMGGDNRPYTLTSSQLSLEEPAAQFMNPDMNFRDYNEINFPLMQYSGEANVEVTGVQLAVMKSEVGEEIMIVDEDPLALNFL